MSGAGEGTLAKPLEKPRADIGFGDALDDFNPAEWAPEPRQRPRIAPEEGRRLAEATGFHSREAVPALQPVPQPAPQAPLRRRRTGRNAQLNLKCRPDTIEAFYAIADGQGWGLGETLEHAVALLQRELSEPRG